MWKISEQTGVLSKDCCVGSFGWRCAQAPAFVSFVTLSTDFTTGQPNRILTISCASADILVELSAVPAPHLPSYTAS